MVETHDGTFISNGLLEKAIYKRNSIADFQWQETGLGIEYKILDPIGENLEHLGMASLGLPEHHPVRDYLACQGFCCPLK